MGIRRDIAKAVANMEKGAQFGGPVANSFATLGGPLAGLGGYLMGNAWDSVNPMSTPQRRAAAQATNAHIARGAAKGLKEAIPGVLDFVGGNGAGFGRSMVPPYDGAFQDRWKEGRNLWRDYVTDPIRSMEMAAGGNKVRDYLNRGVQQAEAAAGGHDDWDDVRETAAEVGTGLAVTWPAYGKAIQAMFKVPRALGKGLAAIPKVGPVASKIPSVAVGYQTMGGPEAVDAVKRGWQWFTGRGYDADPQLAEYRDQNINKAKDLARWYIDNGYRQEFEDLMSKKELWGLLPEKDRNDLIESAVSRFNGGWSQ